MATIAPLLRQRADAPNALEAEQMDNAAQAQAVVEESRVRQRVADAARREEKRLVSEMTPLVGKNAAETFGRLHAAQARAFETAYGVDAADLLRRRSVALGEKGEAEGQTFSQPGTLPSRFAAMPLIEADSTQWFGEGKAIGALKPFYQPETTTVSYPDNGREVGSITPEIAATLRLNKPGTIVLNDIGLQHIEDRHGKEIRGLGFADARAFVDGVLANVSAVYDVDGSGRKYDLVSRAMTPQGRVMVRLEFAAEGDFYTVVTAGTVRRKYYEKKVPLWESANLNHPPEGTPDATFSGQSDTLRQDATTEINLTSGVVHGKRAAVSFQSDGRAAIRIFKGADLSSIPHESAHIFVDDLRRVAADDGSMARERLRSDLEQAGMDGTPFAGILSGEVDAEMARAMLRDAREELAMLDDSDAGLRAAEKVPAKSESSKEGREEIRAALKTNAARRRELLPVERRLSAYVRHLDGLEQAKRDMATLRRFAGVAEDGELTDAQWREVQEYAARGFERYLMVFPTPVGVFLRPAQRA